MKRRLPTPPISRRIYWLSVLAAPLVWLFQEIASWLVLNGTCMATGSPAGGVRLSLLGISGFALLATLATMGISIYLFRHHQDEAPHHLTGMNLSAFQAAISLLINSIFLLAIMWAIVPVFMLPLCEAVR